MDYMDIPTPICEIKGCNEDVADPTDGECALCVEHAAALEAELNPGPCLCQHGYHVGPCTQQVEDMGGKLHACRCQDYDPDMIPAELTVDHSVAS